MNRMVLTVARMLPEEDREVVLGDLCESGLTPAQCLFDLLGLITRRALQPYADWKVWACLALAPLLSMLLIGIGVALTTQAVHLSDGNGLSMSSLVEAMRLGVLLLTAAMTCSIAAFSLAGATPLPLLLAALTPVVLCFHNYHLNGVPSGSIFLFVIPAAAGVWLARRGWHRLRALAVIATLLLVTLLEPFHAPSAWALCNAALLAIPALYCSFTLPSAGRHAHS